MKHDSELPAGGAANVKQHAIDTELTQYTPSSIVEASNPGQAPWCYLLRRQASRSPPLEVGSAGISGFICTYDVELIVVLSAMADILDAGAPITTWESFLKTEHGEDVLDCRSVVLKMAPNSVLFVPLGQVVTVTYYPFDDKLPRYGTWLFIPAVLKDIKPASKAIVDGIGALSLLAEQGKSDSRMWQERAEYHKAIISSWSE